MVFVSADSEHDTPARIKLYLSSFDPRIRGFGTEAQIQKITNVYGVRYKRVARNDGGYTYAHSTLIYLMDRRGRYIGFLDTRTPIWRPSPRCIGLPRVTTNEIGRHRW